MSFTGGGTVSGSITGDGGLEFGGPSFTFSADSSIARQAWTSIREWR